MIYSPNSFVEHALQVPLRQSGAFQILDGSDLLRNDKRLLI